MLDSPPRPILRSRVGLALDDESPAYVHTPLWRCIRNNLLWIFHPATSASYNIFEEYLFPSARCFQRRSFVRRARRYKISVGKCNRGPGIKANFLAFVKLCWNFVCVFYMILCAEKYVDDQGIHGLCHKSLVWKCCTDQRTLAVSVTDVRMATVLTRAVQWFKAW